MTRIAWVFLLFLIALPTFAQARFESLEWWTNNSDSVVIAEVSRVAEMGRLGTGESGRSQHVFCIAREMLKGETQRELFLQQNYSGNNVAESPDKRWQPPDWLDRQLQPKDTLLLFVAQSEKRRTTEVKFWINLTCPDANLASHAAYNNECQRLADSETILTLVKRRIANERTFGQKKRGIIVPFTGDSYIPLIGGIGTPPPGFMRTADPEYKPILVQALNGRDKEEAISNLVSYPGTETADLIRPFLKDTFSNEMVYIKGWDSSGKIVEKTVKVFPVRHAAYTALKQLGESLPPPEGLRPDLSAFTIVEYRSYLPPKN